MDAGNREIDAGLNLTLLQSWIQPQHLETGALKNYREILTNHSARLVLIRNFLVAEVATRLSRFLSEETIFRAEYGLYSSEEPVSEEQFLAAEDSDRFFRMRKLVGTAPQFLMSPNALSYLRFRQVFQQSDFKAFFEIISGLPLGSSDDFGSHMMVAGDFLRPHSDDNKNRRLALVIYLSPRWERDFGGSLHVVDPHGKDIEIVPEYNSMIAFDVLVNSQHLVAPIKTSARLSIGGWYHKPAE